MSWTFRKVSMLGELMDEALPADEVFEVSIEKLIYGGDGLARHEGQTVFVPFSAPGDRLLVRTVEARRNYKRAVIERIITPSPLRRAAACSYFGTCGGCQLQHLNYESQLQSKVGFVRESLKRIGHIDWPGPIPIRHAAEWGYRARAQFKVSEGGNKIGFYQAASHQVQDVAECPILVPELNRELTALRQQRESLEGSTEVELAAGDEQVAGWSGQPGTTPAAVSRRVGDVRYTFDPNTFFQVNSLLLGQLIDTALGEARGKLAVDLYAGVGLFSLPLARRFDRVIAVEGTEQAARFARENLESNSITNVIVHEADVADWLERNAGQFKAVDFVLLDPPRAGVEPQALEGVLRLQPATLVYVSCDPTTLARDLRHLLSAGYAIESITALDLFPQTYHVETCVWLRRQ